MLLRIVVVDLGEDDFHAFFVDHIVDSISPPVHGAHPVFLHAVDDQLFVLGTDVGNGHGIADMLDDVIMQAVG